jgi:hypothetical protein
MKNNKGTLTQPRLTGLKGAGKATRTNPYQVLKWVAARRLEPVWVDGKLKVTDESLARLQKELVKEIAA